MLKSPFEKMKKHKKHIKKGYSSSKKITGKNNLSIKSNITSNINKSRDNLNNPFEVYLSTDLNDKHFHDVALIDKRLFFDYFCDKLKKKQVILELFFVRNPLKPLSIKILLLILDIEVCLVVNAMFINENYVSTIFHSKKEENFISFIPRSINRSIYTIFTSIVVSYFVGCLFVEENKIKGVLRREKADISNMKYKINLIMREIKITYNIFIIIVGGFSFFSWFYISCFNNIYPHMKIEWIKSSLFIIILIHLLSIIVILLETLLRFVSFEIKSERMYRFSLWLG
jgi:hypothetical protein